MTRMTGAVTHAAPPTFAFECTTTFVSGSVTAASPTFDLEIPACPATYTLTGAGRRTPGFDQVNWAINGLFQTSAVGPLGAFCSGTNTTAGTISVQGAASCCCVVAVP